MKTMLGLGRHRYLARLGTLLVAVALIAGTVGCPSPAAEYQLTISSTEGGSVTTPGEGISAYGEGEAVSLVAVPEEGHRFVKWTGDVATIVDTNAASTTITMNADCLITAQFAAVQYDVTITSAEGGVVTTPGEGTLTYDAGVVVDLVAEPEEGYRFVSWTGDVGAIADISAASTAVTINGDYAITANFIARYVLAVNSTDGGEVIHPGEGTFTYDAGTMVDLVAEPGEGYKFLDWSGDADTIADPEAASTTITMTGDVSVTASFMPAHIYLDKIGPGLWNFSFCPLGVEGAVTEEGILGACPSNSLLERKCPQILPLSSFDALITRTRS